MAHEAAQSALLIAASSGSISDPSILCALAPCSKPISSFLSDAEHVLWRLAFDCTEQHNITPESVLATSSSWRELLLGRCEASSFARLKILTQPDLLPGDWIDWTAVIAVVGVGGTADDNIMSLLTRFDATDRRQWLSCGPTIRQPQSCTVEAFGVRGRLVFAQFDEGGLDLPQKPMGGLENADAVIAVCDTHDNVAAGSKAMQLIRRSDAVIAGQATPQRCEWMLNEGPHPKLLAISTSACSASCMTAIKELDIESEVDELDCEVALVPISREHGARRLLQLLVWRLIRQSPSRFQRLKDTGGHRVLDTRWAGQGRVRLETGRKRRAHSVGAL